MKLTFVDSGVLIAATRGDLRVSSAALQILDDRSRTFASSDFVRLETIPKATFYQRTDERQFLEGFFSTVSTWAVIDDDLIRLALNEAIRVGLAAIDALHVAAAYKTGCDELVTTETERKALHCTSLVRVVSIRGR